MANPPPLKDDCFALPSGISWTPVDQALARLKENMRCIVGSQALPIAEAAGRVLASDVMAARANPPHANAAVDGYGFAFAALGSKGPQALPLVNGRSAAGAPYEGNVPFGAAIRILTGASLPQGVDTVIMQEDVQIEENTLYFETGLKKGANCRPMGEDIAAGAVALEVGTRIGPAEIGFLAAIGVSEVEVYQPLRVGVISTGDELCQPGEEAGIHQIFDANRPMLLSLLNLWGFEPVDLKVVGDSAEAVENALDAVGTRCDALLTSGGASAGDEDHMSAVLAQKGQLETWRIAIKPGRPLALAMWKGLPVFGLPGNPVAAFTTAFVFAYPALAALRGQRWKMPPVFKLPAAFEKHKKGGRREYLRARLRDDGRVEVFGSEGSGRISGLAWADGFVELSDEAVDIKTGDLVNYIPFSAYT